ncbi:MAG: radical SAM family heme chaperone HemW [Acidobacteria bacterium]|nr:radical SAM family heme chaperone HemW [Acidobacteriota bacterium]MBV9478653.1 radical SAM family heme chaperone HemW [Acidobacteriota bacterium]
MFSLYLHLPFCHTHCTYCPFAISTDLSQQEAYVEALLREIEAAPRGSAVGTVYFGGGTPSRTSVALLERVFARLRERFAIADDAELSIEANPEDVTSDAIEGWRALGVNRVSIGVQSFHDDELRAIARVHDRVRAIEAIRAVAASGMRTNLDLMLGLPGQTSESFRETLDTAVDLGAGHLSLYMLDLDEKTPLGVQVERGRVTLPDDDLVATLYVDAIERLARAGLAQYEISNFARDGEICRHNLRYWTRGEYHGFGLGAHSFIGGERFANTRDLRRYIDAAPHARDFHETLGADEVRREAIFLGLRQTSGLHYARLVELCGQEGIEWTERGLKDGWLHRVGGSVAFTPAGFLQSNELMSQLF